MQGVGEAMIQELQVVCLLFGRLEERFGHPCGNVNGINRTANSYSIVE